MKHDLNQALGIIRRSPPVRGAWIETIFKTSSAGLTGVAPRAGGVD